jgi:glycine cleavage system H protein
MDIPANRRYSKDHEWALVESDGSVRVGITDFAQHELGDVVYVEVPAVGTRVSQGKQMGEIESVKAVSELFSPVTGQVTEINPQIKTNPELVNSSPYEGGWLVKVKADNAAELKNLLDAAAYGALTK